MSTKTPADAASEFIALRVDLPLDEDAIAYWTARIAEAIEADRAQRAEGRIYVYGEPDDTPNDESHGPICESMHAGLSCTRLMGHDGNHAAGDARIIVGVWA